MKVIDIKNSYPGFDNGYIAYEGRLKNVTGNWGDGRAYLFTIKTEIRENLVVFLSGAGSQKLKPIPNFIFEAHYTTSTDTYGNISVIVQVPDDSIVSYRIAGTTNKATQPNYDTSYVTKASSDQALDVTKLHLHDGLTGRKIPLTNVFPLPGNADMSVFVDNLGTDFCYKTVSPTALIPVFTFPALNEPEYAEIIDVASLGHHHFNWDKATGLDDIGDIYRLMFVAGPELAEIAHHDVPWDIGDPATYDHEVLDSAFAGYEGMIVGWYVIASNEAGQSSTEMRWVMITNNSL